MDTKNEYFTCTGGGRALRTTGACFLSAGGFGRLTCGREKHHGCLTLSLTISHRPLLEYLPLPQSSLNWKVFSPRKTKGPEWNLWQNGMIKHVMFSVNLSIFNLGVVLIWQKCLTGRQRTVAKSRTNTTATFIVSQFDAWLEEKARKNAAWSHTIKHHNKTINHNHDTQRSAPKYSFESHNFTGNTMTCQPLTQIPS